MPFTVDPFRPVNAGGAVSSAGAVTFVNRADFPEKVLRGRGPIVVEFMTYACGHCRRAEPIVHDVARALAGQVTVYQVNVPLEPDLVGQYGIRATPTFIMFKDGRELSRANPEITSLGIRHALTAPFGIR